MATPSYRWPGKAPVIRTTWSLRLKWLHSLRNSAPPMHNSRSPQIEEKLARVTSPGPGHSPFCSQQYAPGTDPPNLPPDADEQTMVVVLPSPPLSYQPQSPLTWPPASLTRPPSVPCRTNTFSNSKRTSSSNSNNISSSLCSSNSDCTLTNNSSIIRAVPAAAGDPAAAYTTTSSGSISPYSAAYTICATTGH
jgi:hypothetical protein